ncbi:DUF6132 family protein [Parapedobacter defluvii]|uniref:DUF6132 family protein n=1 Tax=Parapedobacter defluvii TaxID=2045106 RepID=UPI0016662D0B|nr:DUF6132 family protein [Parapedobacter defluvii]
MKRSVKRHLLTIIGVAIGATAGYLYWKFIGCSTGTCAITSKPLNSTLYGALFGRTSIFDRSEKQKNSMTFQEMINWKD